MPSVESALQTQPREKKWLLKRIKYILGVEGIQLFVIFQRKIKVYAKTKICGGCIQVCIHSYVCFMMKRFAEALKEEESSMHKSTICNPKDYAMQNFVACSYI